MAVSASWSTKSRELFKLLIQDKSREIITKLREDPEDYVISHGCSEKDVLKCIYKILQTGEADFSLKLDVLILLQEHSVLLASPENVEETVIVLRNVVKELNRSDSRHLNKNFFKGQILVTITNILLNIEDYDKIEMFGEMLYQHCNQLGNIICDVNNKNNCLLREVACDCVLEIESNFPCLYFNNLDEFHKICIMENFYPFQNLLNVINCIIKNAVTVTPDRLSRTSEMLTRMKMPALNNVQQVEISLPKLNKIVAEILDLAPLLSIPSMEMVISNLLCVVQQMNLNPLVFKTFCHLYMQTLDLTLFHLVIVLKDSFCQRLFSKEEELHLLNLFLSKGSYSALTVTQRLISLEWMSRCVKDHADGQILKLITESELLIPMPWDTINLRERKLMMLVDVFHLLDNKDNYRHILVKYINDIYSELSQDCNGFFIASLLRMLYHCYSIPDFSVFEADIKRIAFGVLKRFPQFSMHIYNFIKKTETSRDSFLLSNYLLTNSIQYITDGSESVDHYNLDYLKFLSEGSKEKAEISQPRAILKFLQMAVNAGLWKEDVTSSKWLIGHCILDVCKNIICHHNSNYLFVDIGEVLHLMLTQYEDIDVRDRAQFFYMLLITLSPRKLSSLLLCEKAGIRNQLNNFTFEDATDGILAPVLHLDVPLLRLTRVLESANEMVSSNEKSFNGPLERYHLWLNDTDMKWNSRICFDLQIEPDGESSFDELYAIQLLFQGPKYLGEISDVHVLSLTKGEAIKIHVTLQPLEPVPGHVCVSALFNTRNGQTYFCNLIPFKLEFEDLFRPLPFPNGIEMSPDVWKQNLADHLWSIFESNENAGDQKYQSVLRLLINENCFKMLYSQYFKIYVTKKDISGTQPHFTVGMFLPSKTHLIMKFRYIENDRVIVSIGTDNIDILFQC